MTRDTSAIVRSQFGAAAADYATSEVHAKGESLSRIVELAAPQTTWHVLDVATGAGHMAAAFAPHVASVVASDITAEMLTEAGKLAASRNLLNMTTATAEAGSLPFADETFDLVCCRLAAHHFPSLERFVSEVQRVLKKRGRFALVDNVAPDRELLPDASDEDLEDVLIAYNAFEKLRDPSHGFAPPPETWVRSARTAKLLDRRARAVREGDRFRAVGQPHAMRARSCRRARNHPFRGTAAASKISCATT